MPSCSDVDKSSTSTSGLISTSDHSSPASFDVASASLTAPTSSNEDPNVTEEGYNNRACEGGQDDHDQDPKDPSQICSDRKSYIKPKTSLTKTNRIASVGAVGPPGRASSKVRAVRAKRYNQAEGLCETFIFTYHDEVQMLNDHIITFRSRGARTR
ncbi:uncharacterized protein MELLADRAFT_67725 [Melampsora larici-populina 98AG31]|uniref:Uncharacterized protein n=1 Tax=Melampsora larici-populina (strain 98AG31 / pathotype 3-4-7) TaxID=747676 RepID=F4S4C9_MELLP|nr:uncharacterized protein MELLADRAFT_67725 [Melampsora larici-populina 98AG31]EGG00505.1 hypothetical protein MELLADRAFT_67725 [Melampsora larici-populina 98AG31]